MKKILAILLSVMMIVSMAACDGATAPVGGETESESETVSESQDIEPEITITPAAPVSSSEPESDEESSESESSEVSSEAESKPSEASSSQAPKSSASSSTIKNQNQKSDKNSSSGNKGSTQDLEKDGTIDTSDLSGMDKIVANAANLLVANINAERASLGLSKLTPKTKMMEYANKRAEECFQVFDHYRPSGKKYSEVNGIFSNSYARYGENIAMSIQLDEDEVSARWLADDFTEQWIESAEHYANIKNAKYVFTGVGVAYKKLSNGKYQFTAEQFFTGEVNGTGGSSSTNPDNQGDSGNGTRPAYATKLTLDKSYVSIGVGETVVITPSTVKGSISWNATMNPNGCASFSQPGGLKLGVTGLTPGTVTVTATYIDQTATCTIDIG